MRGGSDLWRGKRVFYPANIRTITSRCSHVGGNEGTLKLCLNKHHGGTSLRGVRRGEKTSLLTPLRLFIPKRAASYHERCSNCSWGYLPAPPMPPLLGRKFMLRTTCAEREPKEEAFENVCIYWYCYWCVSREDSALTLTLALGLEGRRLALQPLYFHPGTQSVQAAWLYRW